MTNTKLDPTARRMLTAAKRLSKKIEDYPNVAQSRRNLWNELYALGVPVQTIADECGVTRHAVRKALWKVRDGDAAA